MEDDLLHLTTERSNVRVHMEETERERERERELERESTYLHLWGCMNWCVWKSKTKLLVKVKSVINKELCRGRVYGV